MNDVTTLKNKMFWLYIEPSVFITRNLNRVMFYDALGEKIVAINPSPEINTLVDKFSDPDNLYCVGISEDDLAKKDICDFITVIRDSFIGDLIVQCKNKTKPTIIPPIVKIHKSIDDLEKGPHSSVGDNALTLLNELTIHINGSCSLNCEFCSQYNSQFNCCYQSSEELSINEIKKVLDRLKYKSNINIKLNGGNIFTYSHIFELLAHINNINKNITLCFNYQNLNEMYINEIINNQNIFICAYITFPLNINSFNSFVSKFFKFKDRITYYFIITDDKAFNEAQNIIIENNLENYIYKPFYSGDNLQFFSQNIYLNESDILECLPDKREIFIRQSINSNYWGKLLINTKGLYFSRNDLPSIGNIHEDITTVIHRELSMKQSWFYIRNMEPCNNCIYQWLCPSPSDYELAIDKPNLCHVQL